jgi:hypothetical protein
MEAQKACVLMGGYLLGLLVAAAVCHGAKLDVRASKVVDNVSESLKIIDGINQSQPESAPDRCVGCNLGVRAYMPSYYSSLRLALCSAAACAGNLQR